MKRFGLLVILFLFIGEVSAQGPNGKPRFSPEEFRQKQEEFIIREALLSPAEAARFFPVYHELGKKKFEIDRKIRIAVRRSFKSELSEGEAQKVLSQIDKLQVQKVRLEQTYHEKFRRMLSAQKTLRIMAADAKFDRMLLRNLAPPRNKK
jgi:hypothetical protein